MKNLQEEVTSVKDREDGCIVTIPWKSNDGRSRNHIQRSFRDRISNPQDGFFYFANFDTNSKDMIDSFNIPSHLLKDTSKFEVMDSYDQGRDTCVHHRVFESKGTFLFAKVAPRTCGEHVGGLDQRPCWHDLLTETCKNKPEIKRGSRRDGRSKYYPAHGYRKDPLKDNLSEYSFKPGTSEEIKNHINTGLSNLSGTLEHSSRPVLSGLSEFAVFEDVAELIELPSSSKETCTKKTHTSSLTKEKKKFRYYTTALSIGFEYWSQSHVDQDMMFSSVTAFGPEGTAPDEILQYFVFPDHGLIVPLRDGEVLVFNLNVTHASTNPRRPGTFLVSGHNPLKTVRVQSSVHLKSKSKK
jgi:hypothetical protein